ncbi:portal protein [Acinetobacter puyangensis]|uniref:portal protein n=1 Tax=Acinetobacter puyangensis TaxID=1096779 RepID=UPI003A4D45AF
MKHEDFKRLKKRFDKVWANRVSDMDSHCAELALHVLPVAIKAIKNTETHDRAAWRKIVDNTGKDSLKILAAGMVSGTCSPSRPWFSLTAVDPQLKGDIQVKQWLNSVEDICYAEFAKSNMYRVVHHVFAQEGAFGTGAALIPETDPRNTDEPLMHLIPLTFGEYAITTDYYNKPDGIYRKFKLTVENIVDQFGIDNVSDSIKSNYENGNYDTEYTVCHAIYKRKNAKGNGAKNMPYASIYYEEKSTEKVLRESGFERFACVCPRWNVSSSDIYGEGAAGESLGDMRAIQKGHEQIAKGVDYQVSPPLLIPSYLKGMERETLPNGIAYYNPSPMDNAHQVQPMLNVQFDINGVAAQIQDARQRVKAAFHTDLFLMLDQFEKGKMTATEVAERKNEKMLMLGPVVERQTDELLRPLVELCVARVLQRYPHLLENAPAVLQGSEIKVDFVSILAQAQKAAGSASLERAVSVIGSVAQIDQTVLDKFDTDAFIDEYADTNGFPAVIFRTEKQVQQIRAQRAQAQQQAQAEQQAMQQAAIQQQQAQALKTVGDTDTDNLQNMAGDAAEAVI